MGVYVLHTHPPRGRAWVREWDWAWEASDWEASEWEASETANFGRAESSGRNHFSKWVRKGTQETRVGTQIFGGR